ncbi:hypothetical protein D3C71_1826900 [compost metagenome]
MRQGRLARQQRVDIQGRRLAVVVQAIAELGFATRSIRRRKAREVEQLAALGQPFEQNDDLLQRGAIDAPRMDGAHLRQERLDHGITGHARSLFFASGNQTLRL